MAQLCDPPEDTALYVPAGAEACPASLNPQQAMVLSAAMAQLCDPPEDTAMYVRSGWPSASAVTAGTCSTSSGSASWAPAWGSAGVSSMVTECTVTSRDGAPPIAPPGSCRPMIDSATASPASSVVPNTT